MDALSEPVSTLACIGSPRATAGVANTLRAVISECGQ
jgi:hypothetical protein